MFSLLAACDGDDAAPGTTLAASRSGELGEPSFVTALDGAVAVNLATNGSDPPVVAWTTADRVMAGRLDMASGGLMGSASVNGDVHPVTHPMERPAVRVGSQGTVDIAFPGVDGTGIGIFGTFKGSEPTGVSGAPSVEAVLVHMGATPDDGTVMSWLEDATLSVALPGPDGPLETEDVDPETCECCNPVPRFLDSTLVVAYRDRAVVDGAVVRDVAAIRSVDGGLTYSEPVAIADDHWFLEACPFSGPSVVEVDGDLVVAWMDARQSVHPDQASTTIWVDRSSDAGATFGADLAVATGAVHRWPVMAAGDAGEIHLVWETQGQEGGLSYAHSGDGRLSFDQPRLLVERADGDGGAPGSPSVIVHQGSLVVTWADAGQGYVAAWSLLD